MKTFLMCICIKNPAGNSNTSDDRHVTWRSPSFRKLCELDLWLQPSDGERQPGTIWTCDRKIYEYFETKFKPEGAEKCQNKFQTLFPSLFHGPVLSISERRRTLYSNMRSRDFLGATWLRRRDRFGCCHAHSNLKCNFSKI